MSDAINATGVNQEDYLKLFMQELTYQDPLKPVDNQAFMAQMAQFSALQEAHTTNEYLTQLLGMTSGSQSLALLGKKVKIDNAEGEGNVTKIKFYKNEPPKITVAMSNGDVSDLELSQLLRLGINMSTTYYTSLSGMMAASYGLQNTSNNVANMQSPGFKRSDVFYSSLGNSNGENSLGSGVCVHGKVTNFNAGTYADTNNPADLAVIGDGFFIVRLKNGELNYTRDGEFAFNSDGILVDRRNNGVVQGYDKFGNLVPIHERGELLCPGKASRDLFINGKFVLLEKPASEQDQPGPYKNKYQNIKFEVAKVYDTAGKAHTITFEFESTPVLANSQNQDDGRSWDLIKVSCDDAPIDITPGQQIIFSSINGTTNSDNNRIHFTLNGDQQISLNFGTYGNGSDKSVELKEKALNPEGTQISVWQNDGYGQGKQISFSFDENGQISYNYDNGQSLTGVYVGLARFDDLEHTLVAGSDNLFRAKNEETRHLGRANQDGFGCIKSCQLETANVDSTKEFANIVVLQRMFQACSQIMDIEKQLLEEIE